MKRNIFLTAVILLTFQVKLCSMKLPNKNERGIIDRQCIQLKETTTSQDQAISRLQKGLKTDQDHHVAILTRERRKILNKLEQLQPALKSEMKNPFGFDQVPMTDLMHNKNVLLQKAIRLYESKKQNGEKLIERLNTLKLNQQQNKNIKETHNRTKNEPLNRTQTEKQNRSQRRLENKKKNEALDSTEQLSIDSETLALVPLKEPFTAPTMKSTTGPEQKTASPMKSITWPEQKTVWNLGIIELMKKQVWSIKNF
jgi:hypothetical protein